MTYPNTNKVEYLYNAASELTTVTYKQGTTTLGTLTYTYDAAGNRTKTGGTFARSNVPPALTTTNYNANNQQLTFGTTTETYDLNGNLATTTDAGITTTYTWNARNQLTSISGPSLTASFTYDSFGRRTGKTISAATTNFVYDGLNPVQEKNGATVTANVLTGLGIDEFFTRTDGVGVSSLLPDALGSTVALGDGTGTLQTQYTYEPFGVMTQTGATSTNSYKYTGREDDGTGIMYYRARYYQPRLQRFVAEDPIGFYGGDSNLYAYVFNDPLNWIDPWGLMILPSDPTGLPSPWTHDPSHQDPNGQRFRDPSGRPLDWHPAQPDADPKTWRGRNHWHDPDNFGRKHLPPGTKIPDPAQPPRVRTIPWWKRIPIPRCPIIIINPCLVDPQLCQNGDPPKS